MLTCKETSELISARYDRTLSVGERIGVSLHLMLCRYCSLVARQIAEIQKLVGFKQGPDLSAHSKACLPEKARQEIIETIAKANPTNNTGNNTS